MNRNYIYYIDSEYKSFNDLLMNDYIYCSYIDIKGNIHKFEINFKGLCEAKNYYETSNQYANRSEYNVQLDYYSIFLNFQSYKDIFNDKKGLSWNGILRCPKNATCIECFDFINPENDMNIYIFSTSEERDEVLSCKIDDLTNAISNKIETYNKIRENLMNYKFNVSK